MKRALSRKNLWEQTPAALKAGVGRVLGLAPPQCWLGRQFRRRLAFVRDAQWWPAERAREYQIEQLRRILTLAYERTAYYRRTFDSVGFKPGDFKAPEDLRGLPTMDKNTLREHLAEMCAVDPRSRGVDYVATGGSSGEPLRFYIGADRSAVEYAYLVAGWERIGYRLSLPQAVIRGAIVPADRSGLRHSYDPVLRRHYYSNFHMTDQNMRRYLEHIATIGPCFLHVYPSSVAVLTRFVMRSGVEVPKNIRGILAGSENVYPDDRVEVERVFGVRYYSWYGHSEKLVLGAECERSSGYHVWPTYGHCELLNGEGRPVTTLGECAEIAGTGFINQVVPFIRYRTGDYAVYDAERCRICGREQMILTHVQGRWPCGCLVSKDGSVISMTAFNVHDDMFENVIGYQFRQSVPGKAVIRVVPARPLSTQEQALMLARSRERLQGQVDLDLEICDSLGKTSRGKQLRAILEGAAKEIAGDVR